MYPKKDKSGCLIFSGYENFRPNKTPKEIFQEGAFDGTYWRDIHSSLTGKKYINNYKKYPFLRSIPESKMSRSIIERDISINKYKVHCGSTLEFWEDKGWITKYNLRGWVEWYCDFYLGRRCSDDERQIKRWLALAGPKGRFKTNIINKIKAAGVKYNDYTISPVIRQVLHNWGVELTANDLRA